MRGSLLMWTRVNNKNKLMHTSFLNGLLCLFAVLILGSCGFKKELYTQKGLRQATENREEQLLNKLVAFNRTIGQRDQEINRLQQDSLRLEQGIEGLQQEKKTLEATLREMNSNARSNNQELSTQLQTEREGRRVAEERVVELEGVVKDWRASISALETYARQQSSLIANAVVKSTDGGVRIILPEEELFAKATNTRLSPAGIKNLQPIAAIFQKYPQVTASVQGHTDSQSQESTSSKWNFTSDRSISVVSSFKEEYQVNANQLEPAAMSDHFPLASNSNTDGREQNRRIELVLELRIGDLLRKLD